MSGPVFGAQAQTSIQITVKGEIKTPRTYKIPEGSEVAVAIAVAGGLTELADPSQIVVLRPQK
ncbi:MAG: SLBB domain-containing protein [Opitutaceae bacterium]|nr:SLBB domain-containing protein [Opitutaceae bacterium]MBP9913867.1 SLBB domain-containing protein [Opitutaceae bacterium]